MAPNLLIIVVRSCRSFRSLYIADRSSQWNLLEESTASIGISKEWSIIPINGIGASLEGPGAGDTADVFGYCCCCSCGSSTGMSVACRPWRTIRFRMIRLNSVCFNNNKGHPSSFLLSPCSFLSRTRDLSLWHLLLCIYYKILFTESFYSRFGLFLVDVHCYVIN